MILDQLKFYKKAHKTESQYQLWQEGYQPKLIQGEKMFIDRINYIHQNPLKRVMSMNLNTGDIAVQGIMKEWMVLLRLRGYGTLR